MPFPPPTDRQARIIWAALTGLALATLLALLAGLVWGLGQVLRLLGPVLWPIAVAGVLAYLLDPVVDFLERRKLRRPRAIALVFVLALLVVFGLAASVVPQIVRESRDLARRIPTYVERVQQRFERWIEHPPAALRPLLQRSQPPNDAALSTNAPAAVTPTVASEPPSRLAQFLGNDSVKSASTAVARAVGRAAAWLFGQVSLVASLFGLVAGLALVPIYLFYFLLEKKQIAGNWTDYLPVAKSGFKDELVFVLRSLNDYLIVFFRGQVLVAMCDGVLYTIGFLLIGLPYAVLIGVLATFLTIIPFLGAIATFTLALVIALAQFGDWQHPAMVVAVFGVVQGLEGLLIQPKIIGDRVGLHPVTIIIAIMVGTTLLGGILGGILAIPLTAALRVILGRYVWKRRVATAGN
jgi:predicted PurR-regulated permease PerM